MGRGTLAEASSLTSLGGLWLLVAQPLLAVRPGLLRHVLASVFYSPANAAFVILSAASREESLIGFYLRRAEGAGVLGEKRSR